MHIECIRFLSVHVQIGTEEGVRVEHLKGQSDNVHFDSICSEVVPVTNICLRYYWPQDPRFKSSIRNPRSPQQL